MPITGDLTIRGVTKRITISARLNFFDNTSGTRRVTGTYTSHRNDFGVSINSAVNPIDPEVAVQCDVAFTEPRS